MNSVSVREKIQDYMPATSQIVVSRELIEKIVSLIDLTSLGDADTPDIIAALCKKAVTPVGPVAALCIYPPFVADVKALLPAPSIKIATVVNFPAGQSSIDTVVHSIKAALDAGANEIDLVFPYGRYLAGDKKGAQAFVQACRSACGDDIRLKVILETGAVADLEMIAEMSEVAVLAGADFLKTSTGKIQTGASLAAAAAMLLVIKALQPGIHRTLGFKAAGGVRTIAQAAQYIALAEQIMGRKWASPATFRLGASQLLDAALQTV